MKALQGPPFDQWREDHPRLGIGDLGNGCFNVPLPSGVKLYVIASSGLGWDHVSVHVSGVNRCPTWEEMVAVKRAFFRRDEWAVEFHPPESKNISRHPYTLHLWRCQYAELEVPMSIQV